MGMYDYVRCEMPLPVEIDVDHRDHWFQSKSLWCELDKYEIREGGTLWHLAYETEDQSDPNAEGFQRLVGMQTRVNQRWEQLADFTGEIQFYTQASSIGCQDVGQPYSGWIEFSVYFVRGQLKHFELLRYEEPAGI